MSIASLYPSINPSLLLDFANVKRLDPRITFTRTTTATYYDGVTTAVAEQNLLTYSQEFDNAAWSKNNATVTANSTAAPDGTTTADALVPNTTSSANHQTTQNIPVTANLTYTFSIYVKAFGYTKFSFRESNISGAYYTFNLTSSGSVISSSSIGSVTVSNGAISSIGSGWYRVSFNISCSSSSTLGIAFFALNNSYTTGDPYSATFATGDGTSGVYIWGAQLEERSSATAYTATTTQAITNYIPVLQTAAAGQARFDHNPTTGESLGLLIEEARTNLATYSADFSNAAWTKGNATITANTIVAPDGTLTGDKAVETTTASVSHYIAQNSITVSSGAVVTLSVFAKSGERTRFGLIEPYVNKGSFFDLSNGTVVGNFIGAPTSSSITPVGNGWYRCSITTTASGTTSGFELYTVSTGTTYQYTGDGFSGVFLWGAQLEAGSFATSYIPTVASTVTRNADAASMTGTNFSSWFNNGEGTVYFEAQPMYVGTASASLNSWLWDGTNSNIIAVGQNAGSGQALFVDAVVRINGSDAAYGYTTTGVTTASAFKSIAAYEFNNTGAYLNGASFLTDTSCTIPVVNQWKFGGNYGGSNTSNGWVRKLSYYPQRLSATNLAALTT
jgi:hypothetical protein